MRRKLTNPSFFLFLHLYQHPNNYHTALIMKRIAILASGSGSNAENIADHFKNNPNVVITHILTNKKDAFVIERAKKMQIPCSVFNRTDFYETNKTLNFLIDQQIDLIVLAGFLWLVPQQFTKAFPNKIINIHPALLPKYGGKGMYGHHVHQAVVDNKESESGITIHYVNENYDEGNIIYQAKCKVYEKDTADDVATKVHKLEYQFFPEIIEQVLSKI